jgi:hypothetical protein
LRLLPPAFVELSPADAEAAIEALANLLAARQASGGPSDPDGKMGSP